MNDYCAFLRMNHRRLSQSSGASFEKYWGEAFWREWTRTDLLEVYQTCPSPDRGGQPISSSHKNQYALLGALWSDYKKKKGTGAVTPNVPSPKSSGGKAKKQKNPAKASKSTKSQVGVGTLHFVCSKKG